MADKKTTAKRGRPRKDPTPVQTAEEVGHDPAIKVKPGDIVFLTYMSSPDITIAGNTLHWKNREMEIPADIDPKELIKAHHAVVDGSLTVGELPKEARAKLDKASYIDKDASVLEWCERRIVDMNDLRELCSGLTRAGAHLSGWAPKDLLSELIKVESRDRARPVALRLLNTALEQGRLISFRSVPFDPKLHATSEVQYKVVAEPTRG